MLRSCCIVPVLDFGLEIVTALSIAVLVDCAFSSRLFAHSIRKCFTRAEPVLFSVVPLFYQKKASSMLVGKAAYPTWVLTSENGDTERCSGFVRISRQGGGPDMPGEAREQTRAQRSQGQITSKAVPLMDLMQSGVALPSMQGAHVPTIMVTSAADEVSFTWESVVIFPRLRRLWTGLEQHCCCPTGKSPRVSIRKTAAAVKAYWNK